MRNEKKIYEETELSKIKVPPKMFKRMKPKDAELTVIGLPSSEVSKINNFKPSITSFFKLKGIEKDRFKCSKGCANWSRRNQNKH